MIFADASPLIALNRIGIIEVLPPLYDETIIVPPAVVNEVLQSGYLFRAGQPGWLIERRPQNSDLVDSLKAQLDPGESEAIALALELGSDLLIDERAGRRVARSMGINVIGTGGALLDAKRHSLIPSLTAALEELQAAKFRLDIHVVELLLKAACESNF